MWWRPSAAVLVFRQRLSWGKTHCQRQSDGPYPFSIPDGDLASFEIDVLDPEAEAFHEAQAGAVHQAGHEPFLVAKMGEYRFHFLARQYNR
jgi:hypothetical protein